MSEFSDTQVRQLDFMLLLVLREGVRRRKLSDVASTLGVTQTAISHSVAKLRTLFDDELFIRRPHGVDPTARAVQLARIAERVIETAGTMLADPSPFDPMKENRELRICALDYEISLLSRLVEVLHDEAPGIRFHFKGMGRDEAVAALERDEADLWIGFARQLPGTLESKHLFDETYKVIARADHPRIAADGALTIDTYCSERHVVAAPGGKTGGIVDKSLQAEGRSRNVSVTTTGFLSTVDLVSRTDLIATVPARLARAHSDQYRLIVTDPPITPRPFQVHATWHRRMGTNPAIAWVVERVRQELN